MKDKLFLTIATLFLISATTAVFSSPTDSTIVETRLDLENGWNEISVPVDGAVDVNAITDGGCNLDVVGHSGEKAIGYEGSSHFTNTLNGMRGYAIKVTNPGGCTAVIESNEVQQGSLNTRLPSDEWVVVSTPTETTLNELVAGSDCEIQHHRGNAGYLIRDGNQPIDSRTTLSPTKAYWIRVTGSGDCELDRPDIDQAVRRPKFEDRSTDHQGSIRDSGADRVKDDNDGSEYLTGSLSTIKYGESGEPIAATILARNTGPVGTKGVDTATFTLEVGDVTRKKTVTLGGGNTERLSFEHFSLSSGTYTATLSVYGEQIDSQRMYIDRGQANDGW